MLSPDQNATAASNATSGRINIRIWLRETAALSPQEVVAAERYLSSDERAHADRYRFPRDRRDYIVAHDLLRQALSIEDPRCAPAAWLFGSGTCGKPEIVGPVDGGSSTQFSLTHTRGLVACAVSAVPVGIDLELVTPNTDFLDIATRCFTSAETEALKLLNPYRGQARFVELWTLKEAFLKAVGCGLTGALDAISFEVSESGQVQHRFKTGIVSGDWHFRLFSPAVDARCAVAVKSSRPPQIEMRRL